MRWNRLLPILVLLLTLTLLAGAFRLAPAPAPAAGGGLSFEALRQQPADPSAEAWLARAAEALAAPRVAWVETALWQKVSVPDLAYQAEGRLLLAPEGRFRLELSLTPGQPAPDSTRLQVSDGTNLWTARRENGEWVEVSRRVRGSAPVPAEEPASPATAANPLLAEFAVPGVGSLLATLRQRLRWVEQEALADGRQVRLTGVLAPGAKGSLSGPRICRLVLDTGTLWPGRIEWYGPVPGQAEDRLLVEMEYRDPVLNHPLPPEVCAREFSLRAVDTIVTDLASPQ
jgi:hypothetical protein